MLIMIKGVKLLVQKEKDKEKEKNRAFASILPPQYFGDVALSDPWVNF